MNTRTLRPSHKLIASLLIVNGLAAMAAPADVSKGFTCQSGHRFDRPINAYIQSNVLQPKPFDSMDAVLSFAANEGFTAFQYPLVAVVAWDADSPTFGRGPGTAPPVHFSFVVRAPAWKVQNILRAQRIPFHAGPKPPQYPYVAVEPYNTSYSEPLPAGADDSSAYTRVTCYPRP